ncbi:MAG: hypothetical protein IKA37_07855, partial [Spirochaetales bacterium]|nr:hypothetical protein [Spirochaetales bacterium]
GTAVNSNRVTGLGCTPDKDGLVTSSFLGLADFRHIINKLNCNFFINIDKKQIIKKFFWNIAY